MKTLIFLVAVAVVGLALAGSGKGNSSAQDGSRIEQGVQQIDSVLGKGLTPETHDAVSSKARVSAEWLKTIEQRAVGVAK